MASLRLGDSGTTVVLLQDLLRGSLDVSGEPLPQWYTGTCDGDFGPHTEAAVKAFQEQYGLGRADGVVGPRTRQKLFELTGYDIELLEHPEAEHLDGPQPAGGGADSDGEPAAPTFPDESTRSRGEAFLVAYIADAKDVAGRLIALNASWLESLLSDVVPDGPLHDVPTDAIMSIVGAGVSSASEGLQAFQAAGALGTDFALDEVTFRTLVQGVTQRSVGGFAEAFGGDFLGPLVVIGQEVVGLLKAWVHLDEQPKMHRVFVAYAETLAAAITGGGLNPDSPVEAAMQHRAWAFTQQLDDVVTDGVVASLLRTTAADLHERWGAYRRDHANIAYAARQRFDMEL